MQHGACSPSCRWLRDYGVQVGEPVSEDLTLDEMRSHMALWSIAKSPLMISADLRCSSPAPAGILLVSLSTHEHAAQPPACMQASCALVGYLGGGSAVPTTHDSCGQYGV